MKNWQKGETALLKIALRATEKGIIVSRPIVEGTRYDLIFDINKTLQKVQIKWCDTKAGNGAVGINLFKSDRRSSQRRKIEYTEDDFDLLLVYLPKTDKIYAFSSTFALKEHKGRFNLRYLPSKNSQIKKCINASEYEW